MKTIFDEFQLGEITLKNRMIMAPMTRSRAINNVPNDMMATYYAQRADMGLLITEGTSPSPNGLGYPRIPGIYNQEQIDGWKKITAAVHEDGGKIFLQIMHTGRVSHPDNLPPNSKVLAPSAIASPGEMYTDNNGMQALPIPQVMTLSEVKEAIAEYVQSAENAILAGFDGVEIHGANGYLVNQFLSPISNQRTDEYGGSAENRIRFAMEVARGIVAKIGANKTGIRLSPYGVFNGMGPFDDIDATYTLLATELGKLNLAYIHLVDHSSMGAPEVPASIKESIKNAFKGTIIASGGLDKEKATQALQSGTGELVAFGRPLIANPDFVHKMENGIELNVPDPNTFYTPGEKGYIDYPIFA